MGKSTNFILVIGFIILTLTIWFGGKELKQDIVLEMSELRVQLETTLQTLDKTVATVAEQIHEQVYVQPAKIMSETQENQIESTLTSLRKDAESSTNLQNDRLEKLGEQIAQLNTALTNNIVALANEQNKRFKWFESQLQTLGNKVAVSHQQNVKRTKMFNGNLAGLVTQQNNALKDFETQLQALKETKESSSPTIQNAPKIEQLTEHLSQLGAALATLQEKSLENQSQTKKDVVLINEQNEKFKKFEDQLQTLETKIVASNRQDIERVKMFKGNLAGLVNQQGNVFKGFETQLQNLKDIALANKQDKIFKQFATQLQTLETKIVASNQQNIERTKMFKGNLVGLVQAMNETAKSSPTVQNGRQIEQLTEQLSQLGTVLSALQEKVTAMEKR